MNKYLVIFILILAVALIAYNSTVIDFQNPFEGQSIIALICIVATLCAIVLLLVFITSKKIQDKMNQNH